MKKRPSMAAARGRRRDGPQQSDLPAPLPGGAPYRAPEEGRRTDNPPPRQTDQPAAGQTAPGARGCQTAPAEHVPGRDARRSAAGHEGGPGLGSTGRPPGGGWQGITARQPPLSPLSPPPRPAGRRSRATEAPARYPLKGQREVRPPPERAAAPGGKTPLSQYATCSPAPTRLLPQRPRQAGRPAPAPQGPRPGSARKHESEQYGEHALHELSDANNTRFGARPGKAGGGTEVERPPAPRGPPATPPGRTAHKPPPSPAPPWCRNAPDTRARREGANNPMQGKGGTGPGHPPTKQARQRTGPKQEMQRDTDRMKRP